MENTYKKISLGFTQQEFEPGVHICQIYNNEEERHGALVNFVISGLQSGENAACFTEKESAQTLQDFFKENGFEYTEIENSGSFSLSKTADVYFREGAFDPDRMLELLQQYYQKSISENRSGARVIGEMTPEIEKVSGGSRLLEYESKVSLLLKNCPINTVCQYDARAFDGSTILDILKVHPYMIVRGQVVRNPFFIQPEEFLSKE